MGAEEVTGFRRVGGLVRHSVRRAWGDFQAALYTRGALSAAGLTLPDYLGIGAQKAGTSWLYFNFRCHPEMFVTKLKELHHFDHNLHRGLKWYARNFEAAGDKVKGEITPSYGSICLDRIRYVRTVVPNVRLIFLMRNPVDRAWSQAQMNLLKRTGRGVAEVPEEEFLAHFTDERSIKRGDYCTIIENWESVFPKEQLFVGFFEDIAARPKELLSEIFSHVGVSSDVDWSTLPYQQVVHEGVGDGKPMPEKYKLFLEQLYRAEIEWLADRFGSHAEAWRSQLSSCGT